MWNNDHLDSVRNRSITFFQPSYHQPLDELSESSLVSLSSPPDSDLGPFSSSEFSSLVDFNFFALDRKKKRNNMNMTRIPDTRAAIVTGVKDGVDSG